MDTHEGDYGRFKVIDHLAFGKLMALWATDRETTPKTLDDLKMALEPNIAMVPTRYKRMTVVQAAKDEFVLRLPPTHMVNNTIAELSGPRDATQPYAVPPFYTLKLRAGDGSPAQVTDVHINDVDFFYCRVADYTVSVCR